MLASIDRIYRPDMGILGTRCRQGQPGPTVTHTRGANLKVVRKIPSVRTFAIPGSGTVRYWFSVSTLREADYPYAPANSGSRSGAAGTCRRGCSHPAPGPAILTLASQRVRVGRTRTATFAGATTRTAWRRRARYCSSGLGPPRVLMPVIPLVAALLPVSGQGAAPARGECVGRRTGCRRRSLLVRRWSVKARAGSP
jgi:hypothetical protein